MVDLADYRGARGSNAGDEFHELWALEQVLALLAPNTELRAVKVEGVRTGGSGADTNEPFWDSVDCSLYFGGSTLEAADAVELVQLKYSSDPSRAWSVARLTASSAKTGNNSILRKLADDYQSARPRMKPEAALKLRFVSNQALAPAVNEAVKAGARGDPYAAAVAKDLACLRRQLGCGDRIASTSSHLSICRDVRRTHGSATANASSAQLRSSSRTAPRTLRRS